jgi:ribosomal protein L11 methyltransferase
MSSAINDHMPVITANPNAGQATRLNALVNQVDVKAGLPDTASGRYGTVLANILATPLKVLAPLLWSRVSPGGCLVLAGILQRQASELTQAYAPFCQLEVADQEDGWILMTAKG